MVLTRSARLPGLKHGTSAIPVEESVYEYDGSLQGAQQSIETIVGELEKYGIPWFMKAEELSTSDVLVQESFQWLRENSQHIPVDIADALNEEISAADYKRSRVSLPYLDALKDRLRRVAADNGLSKSRRQQITVLAMDVVGCAHLLIGRIE